MAAIIDSLHKEIDMHDTGVHGFTNGDAPSNSKPTELTAAWCNAVQQEINNAIVASGEALNDAKDDQLGEAILTIAYEQKPRDSGKTAIFVQFDEDVANVDAAAWGEYKRTGRDRARAGGGAAFKLASLAMIPNNAAVLVEYAVTVVKSTDKTAYYMERGVADFARGTNSGTSVEGSTTPLWSAGTLVVTVTIRKDANGYPSVEIDPSALSALSTYNTTVSVTALLAAQT